MNLKANQWWEDSNGKRFYIFADLREHGVDPARNPYIIVAFDRDAEVFCFTHDGRSSEERGVTKDLREHLSDCTGFNWKDPQWRKPVIDDLKNGPIECRARYAGERDWNFRRGKLHQIDTDNVVYTVVTHPGFSANAFPVCEVRKKPAVSSSVSKGDV